MANISQPIGRVLAQSSVRFYICRSCRQHVSPTGIVAQQRRFLSNQETSSTGKIRRKLWSDEGRIGRADANGTPTFLQKRRMRHQANKTLLPKLDSSTSTPQHAPTRSNYELVSVDEASPEAKDYVPAVSWEEAEYIGTDGNWRHAPSQPKDAFSAWLHPGHSSAASREQLICALHQAIVACLACRQTGLDLSKTSHLKSVSFDSDAFESATISLSEAGALEDVQFRSVEQLQDFILKLEDANEETSEVKEIEGEGIGHSAAPGVTQSATGETSYYPVQSESFLQSRLDIEDPITFVILKRFSSLSGHRIPDPIVNTLLTSRQPLSFLIDQLYKSVVAPEPKKLGDVLANREDLLSQANVMVFGRRETPVDKEKELGRWKVIEKELKERGLPVLGKLKLAHS